MRFFRILAIAACVALALAGQVLVFLGGAVTGFGLANGQQVRQAGQGCVVDVDGGAHGPALSIFFAPQGYTTGFKKHERT